jgi:hypothetical protein
MKQRLTILTLLCALVLMTTAAWATTITSTGTGGNWSSTATWSPATVPGSGDDVIIADGTTVTIDATPITINSLVVGGGSSGILLYDGTARSLTVTTNIIINSGASFNAGVSALTTHTLAIGGDLTVNGIFDMYTTAGVTVTFTGASNNSITGSGPTVDIYAITLNKGTSYAPILELNTTNFTVRGSATPVAATAWLTLTSGTFKISGSFTMGIIVKKCC